MTTHLTDKLNLRSLASVSPSSGYSKYALRPMYKLAFGLKGSAKRVHIIATPRDYEFLALPFAYFLNRHDITADCSCVWPSIRSIGKEGKTEIAPISMSFDQSPLDDENADLIIVNSFVDDTVVIESMLSYAHPVRDMKYKSISVFAPFARRGTRREFSSALRKSELERFVWQNSVEFTEELEEELRPIVENWIAQTLDLSSPEKLASYFPRTIRTYLNNQPRPENPFTPRLTPNG